MKFILLFFSLFILSCNNTQDSVNYGNTINGLQIGFNVDEIIKLSNQSDTLLSFHYYIKNCSNRPIKIFPLWHAFDLGNIRIWVNRKGAWEIYGHYEAVDYSHSKPDIIKPNKYLEENMYIDNICDSIAFIERHRKEWSKRNQGRMDSCIKLNYYIDGKWHSEYIFVQNLSYNDFLTKIDTIKSLKTYDSVFTENICPPFDERKFYSEWKREGEIRTRFANIICSDVDSIYIEYRCFFKHHPEAIWIGSVKSSVLPLN